ncbi:hypothetical protein BH23GEM6_BH23GEM6_13220 [soil metagenome]
MQHIMSTAGSALKNAAVAKLLVIGFSRQPDQIGTGVGVDCYDWNSS